MEKPFTPDPPRGTRETGSIIVGALVAVVMVLGLIFASTVVSQMEIRSARQNLNKIQAYFVAQAGIERSINYLKAAVRRTDVFDPMMGIQNLFADGPGHQTIHPFIGEPVTDGTHTAGEFTVTMVPQTIPDGFEIKVLSTGYTPYAPGSRPEGGIYPVYAAMEVVLQLNQRSSQVFDSAYFINNWAWLYGDTIAINGNVRCNGQMDAGGYRPQVTGQPRYERMVFDPLSGAVTLHGYQDDNGDGLQDGNDGGIFAGWDIVGAERVRGVGGWAGNQHDFAAPVSMPNLTNLDAYEARAVASGGSIRIGGMDVSDAVYGDDPSDKRHLFLIGTPAAPIEINGTVVVRGDVVIGGYVTGQGALYSGGNVFIPSDLRYANGPITPRPLSNSQADTEAWLTTNWNKDFLGLFARENITVGDHTDSMWRRQVDPWMSHSLNPSAEDLGEDGIPNTLAGRDGILGTVDDDVLEADGEFTVEFYSEMDQTLGLIPPGYTVGSPVPGSGEDIDGDGEYDDTLTLADLALKAPLEVDYWGGNLVDLLGGVEDEDEGGVSLDYSDLATTAISHLDGVFYTNHAFSMYSSAPGTQMNGAIVCRNEQIIYTTQLVINYDCRMLGGGGIAKEWLPQNIDTVEVLSWRQLGNDPNYDVR